MRLLFVDFSLPHLLADDAFPVGGFAVQLEQWLAGLGENGVACGVLTWKGANAHVGRALPFELLETYDPKAGVRVLKYFYAYIPSMLAAARAFRPDAIVQSIASVHTGIMAHIAGRLGVPFVYRIACDSDVDGRLSTLLKPYERISYRHGLGSAGLVICQNGYQVAQMQRLFPGKPLLLIENTIRMPPGDAPPCERSGRSYIAWLGVFREQKNIPLLLRAAEALPGVAFRVAGMSYPGTDAETLAALAALETLPNVRMTGYLKRAQVPEFLAHATGLLCTSHFEGFSNTFLEAFAGGTPVITRKGVDPDGIVKRHHLGYAAESDADLIASAGRLSALPAGEYAALAGRARAHVMAHHAPRAAMQKVIRKIEEVVACRQ